MKTNNLKDVASINIPERVCSAKHVNNGKISVSLFKAARWNNTWKTVPTETVVYTPNNEEFGHQRSLMKRLFGYARLIGGKIIVN